MLTLLAWLLVQVSVTIPPLWIVAGEAFSVTVGAAGGVPFTVTVAEEEALPPAPVAVNA